MKNYEESPRAHPREAKLMILQFFYLQRLISVFQSDTKYLKLFRFSSHQVHPLQTSEVYQITHESIT